MDPYLQPLYDALRDMIPSEKLAYYIENGVIQIAPIAFIAVWNGLLLLSSWSSGLDGWLKPLNAIVVLVDFCNIAAKDQKHWS